MKTSTDHMVNVLARLRDLAATLYDTTDWDDGPEQDDLAAALDAADAILKTYGR